MPDHPKSSSHAGDNDAPGDGRGPAGGLAGWQKVVGLVGLAVVGALVILLLAGDHGPGRHAPGGDQQQPADVEGGAGHDPARSNH
jgi:hypothetical protein